MWEILGQIGASGFYPVLKRHPRGPESVDGRAPKSGSPASTRAYSHPAVVNLLWRNLGLNCGYSSNTHQVGLPSGRNPRSKIVA